MLSRSRLFLCVGALVVWGTLLLVPGGLSAATYYVDPLSGADSNTGLTRAQAWQHIPGTYKNDDSGFVAASGWVVINAGDTVRVRSGTTITNRLLVSADWYRNGTSSAPVTIMRDSTWGTGAVTFDGTSQTLALFEPLVFVWQRNYVHIDGATPGGIVIQNSKARGFQGTGTSESSKMTGLSVANVKLFNNVEFNVNVQRNDSFLFQNVEIDGNHQNGPYSGGFMIGDNTYGCSNGTVADCESYNNGDVPGTSPGGTNTWIGFWATNSTNITFLGCVSHDNKGNGYDTGVVGSPPSVVTNNIKYVDCESYNNSNGFSCNLDDITGTANFWYVNCISWTNGAGWIIYQGPSAHVYNCLTTGNAWGIYIDAPTFTHRSTVVDIKNTIFYRNDRTGYATYPWDLWTHHTESLALTSDYNDFEQGNQSTCISWDGAEIFEPYYYNSTDAPGSVTRNWYKNHRQDAHSVCSVDNRFADFVNPAAHDYHLAAASSLIGKGVVINNQAIPEVSKDFDGNARPSSGPWDIGPYQHKPTACTFSLNPAGASFGPSGGSGSVSVATSSSSCAWTAVANNPWIAVTSRGSGTGTGSVSYRVAANTGAARTGSITIAGHMLTVTQAADPPRRRN